ncbi:hypothetical protein [Gordonia sp. ABSL49_1]|uniref:hypothetical protein n=1 Tax=unclassified Gordonia (in: high G+C Gram-positive bacteria) TaxID=2657482 RepID=UPI001F111AE1|nr:hypothetical protein [Gordonia sp. ABSL49_1]MCH5641532.1 hypothetical protein [Gordonia sp. ABSL49_1]
MTDPDKTDDTVADNNVTDDFTTVDDAENVTVEEEATAPRTPTGKSRRRSPGSVSVSTSADDADESAAKESKAEDSNAEDSGADDTEVIDTADTVPVERKTKPAQVKSDGVKDGAKKEFTLTVSRSGLLRAAAVLAVVALLACIGFLGWRLHEKNERLAAFDDSIAASKHFINELVATMPANAADQYKDRLGPLSTGEFKETLARERTATEQQTRDIKVTDASANIKLATVEQFTSDTATTLLQVEVTASGAMAATPQKATFFYLINLEKVDGEWLVSKLGTAPDTGVLFGDGTRVPPNGTPTPAPSPTPTPAPAPAPGG